MKRIPYGVWITSANYYGCIFIHDFCTVAVTSLLIYLGFRLIQQASWSETIQVVPTQLEVIGTAMQSSASLAQQIAGWLAVGYLGFRIGLSFLLWLNLPCWPFTLWERAILKLQPEELTHAAGIMFLSGFLHQTILGLWVLLSYQERIEPLQFTLTPSWESGWNPCQNQSQPHQNGSYLEMSDSEWKIFTYRADCQVRQVDDRWDPATLRRSLKSEYLDQHRTARTLIFFGCMLYFVELLTKVLLYKTMRYNNESDRKCEAEIRALESHAELGDAGVGAGIPMEAC